MGVLLFLRFMCEIAWIRKAGQNASQHSRDVKSGTQKT